MSRALTFDIGELLELEVASLFGYLHDVGHESTTCLRVRHVQIGRSVETAPSPRRASSSSLGVGMGNSLRTRTKRLESPKASIASSVSVAGGRLGIELTHPDPVELADRLRQTEQRNGELATDLDAATRRYRDPDERLSTSQDELAATRESLRRMIRQRAADTS